MPPLFIEVAVPTKKSEPACLCLLRVSIFPVSTIFALDFGLVRFMVFNATFNNISVILWRSVLLMEVVEKITFLKKYGVHFS